MPALEEKDRHDVHRRLGEILSIVVSAKTLHDTATRALVQLDPYHVKLVGVVPRRSYQGKLVMGVQKELERRLRPARGTPFRDRPASVLNGLVSFVVKGAVKRTATRRATPSRRRPVETQKTTTVVRRRGLASRPGRPGRLSRPGRPGRLSRLRHFFFVSLNSRELMALFFLALLYSIKKNRGT